MPDLDRETLNQVLSVARERGYRYVRLRTGQHKFEADLPEQDFEAEEAAAAPDVSADASMPKSGEEPLKAPVVGYYRQPQSPLAVGVRVKRGQVVGEVVALGIANEIVSDLEGEVTELLVDDGAALEYGQVLAKVKLS